MTTLPAAGNLDADADLDLDLHQKRRRSGALLTGIAVFVSVLWFVSFVFGGGGSGGGSGWANDWLRIALGVAGGMVAPALACVVTVRMFAPALRLSPGRTRVLLVTAIVAFCSTSLLGLSWSAGFDDADAGRPAGLFASLTVAFAVTGALATAASIALVLFAVFRARDLSVRASTAIATGVGIVSAPLVIWTLLSPVPIVALCATVFVLAIVPSGRTRATRQRPVAVADLASADLVGVRERVTFYAAVSLATTLVVWAGGLAVSIQGTGTDLATTGLGMAAAAGQVAVIPLLWAATLTISTRLPAVASTLRVGFVAASTIVAVAVIIMVVGYSAEGDLFVNLGGMLSVGVGVWLGALVWALTSAWHAAARAGASAVVVAATAVGYAVFVVFSGGVTLALVSGLVAFGGARLLLRTPPAGVVSPARPQAS